MARAKRLAAVSKSPALKASVPPCFAAACMAAVVKAAAAVSRAGDDGALALPDFTRLRWQIVV